MVLESSLCLMINIISTLIKAIECRNYDTKVLPAGLITKYEIGVVAKNINKLII